MKSSLALRSLLPLLATLTCLLAAAPWAAAGTTECVSVDPYGLAANGSCAGQVSLIADGRFVVFASDASNLVNGDTNGVRDIFLRDRARGTTQRISVSTYHAQTNGPSTSPRISADGHFVVFASEASNLVPGDTNGVTDIFVYEVGMGATSRVSLTNDGQQANGPSSHPAISADGRYIVFESQATNLDNIAVPGVFLLDRATGHVSRVSLDNAGMPLSAKGGFFPSVTDDGRFVAFMADIPAPGGGSHTQILCRDRQADETILVSRGSSGDPGDGDSRLPALSGDGRYLVFQSAADDLTPNDPPGWDDIFLWDAETGLVTKESVGPDPEVSDGTSSDPAITPDGRFLAYVSGARSLLSNTFTTHINVYARDRDTQLNSLVSRYDGDYDGGTQYGHPEYTAISADGRFVAFTAPRVDPVTGSISAHPQVFVRDRQTFADVSVGEWAYSYIESAYTSYLVNGYPDGSYHPADPVTRDQMAVYLARAIAGDDRSITAPAEASFTDVPPNYWAFRYIEYVTALGLVYGYNDGGYHPGETVTRDQMAVFMARALAGGDAAIPSGPAQTVFPDVTSTQWANKYIAYCVQTGLVTGYPDGLYHPEDAVTRDQMAVYIQRLLLLPIF